MQAVTLRFLGSGDAFGDGGRFQACLLLDGPDGRVLIDCGATSLVAIKRDSIDPSSIETILVSHLHGDHFAGIPFFVLDGQFSQRERPLTVAGPSGVQARVEAAMEVMYPGSTGVQRRFEVRYLELEDRVPCAIGSTSVAPYAVDHASGATPFALRIEYAGKVVAYSGDTAWTDVLLEAAEGADLFVCEAYTAERAVKYHVDYPSLLRNARRITARRTILTHMGPSVLALPSTEFERAFDGLAVEL